MELQNKTISIPFSNDPENSYWEEKNTNDLNSIYTVHSIPVAQPVKRETRFKWHLNG